MACICMASSLDVTSGDLRCEEAEDDRVEDEMEEPRPGEAAGLEHALAQDPANEAGLQHPNGTAGDGAGEMSEAEVRAGDEDRLSATHHRPEFGTRRGAEQERLAQGDDGDHEQ